MKLLAAVKSSVAVFDLKLVCLLVLLLPSGSPFFVVLWSALFAPSPFAAVGDVTQSGGMAAV